MGRFLRTLFPLHSPVRKLWYSFKAFTAAILYGFPARHLKILGVTGTDGKTTTVGMISQILVEANIPHLKISTATLFLNGREWENTSKRTTLSPFLTQKLLRRAIRGKAQIAVLEVSSHATEQRRIWGIRFDVAGITNITEEHLDDHGGFEAYANAKKKLFTEYLKSNGTAVLNADDLTVSSWEKDISQKKIWTSSQYSPLANISAENFRNLENGIEFFIDGIRIFLPVLGEFNMENALIAYGITSTLGITPEVIAQGLAKFTGTSGRMEALQFGQKFKIYVDDALTPNAIEKGLISLRAHTTGNIWAVFGCCGTRDQGKRPKIGKIVGEFADRVILTDDEPYTEPADQIRNQVKEGIQTTKIWNTPAFQEIPDRKAAIEFALQNAEEDDTVFIFGMGSYNSRNIGGEEIPWSDKDVIQEILEGSSDSSK